MNVVRRTIWFLAGVLLALVVLRVLLKPQRIVKWLATRSPRVLFSHKTTQPVIALTIDDGPDPIGSPLILEVLARNRVPATFFLISGHIRGSEALERQMVAQGHELGNHTTQDRPSILLSPEQFESDVRKAHTALLPFVERVQWFRPGLGWYTPQMLDIPERCLYQCALGSVFPYDPFIPVVAFSTAFILSNVAPGAVIILHDGSPGPRTAQTLARIIPARHARGFRFVTLSELVTITPSLHIMQVGNIQGPRRPTRKRVILTGCYPVQGR